ncbi:triose-phosphate isomerase [Lichenihabitans psoromatis]|uniref:triose-phosphate isomerase n=1 Tax=Lichenihabitans psoromatis TaxID=2528642 RepID=UPI0010384744|nr:triose-phosphate isomerase [Lichenihabitans psoromatis]
MAISRNALVAGNWKMNGVSASLAELKAIAEGVAGGAAGTAACAICLPATLLARGAEIAGQHLLVGGQDCSAETFGAHTGDLAAEMLRDSGASLVIVGHSERRADHGETNAVVRAKAEAAYRAGLTAIICVGETRPQRDAGDALEICGAQLEGSLPPGATPDNTVLAYEPVWAIGTGLVPTVDDVAAMHAFFRAQLKALLPHGGDALRILYGGSVKPDNAESLMRIDNVDGALIGGASLKAKDFLAIASVYA